MPFVVFPCMSFGSPNSFEALAQDDLAPACVSPIFDVEPATAQLFVLFPLARVVPHLSINTPALLLRLCRFPKPNNSNFGKDIPIDTASSCKSVWGQFPGLQVLKSL